MDLMYVDSDGNSIEVEKHGVIDNEVVDCDKTKEPCVGMTFDSFEEAKGFYEGYGRLKGYNVRTRSTYRDRRGPEVTSALFVCSCEGFSQTIPKNDDDGGKIKRSSSTLRSGCKACMRITNIKGTTIWRITVFSDKHNHKMFVPGKTDFIKCNKRKPRVSKSLTEGMRISHICRRLTQLAYMAGRSEEIYKVVLADMDETFQKVSLMDRELHKYEKDDKLPNEASKSLKNTCNAPAEEVGSNNQTILLDSLALQAKGRKRTVKGKEKVGSTGRCTNELEIEVSVACKTPQPEKTATLEGYFSDSNNCACKKMKPEDSKSDITHNTMQTNWMLVAGCHQLDSVVNLQMSLEEEEIHGGMDYIKGGRRTRSI